MQDNLSTIQKMHQQEGKDKIKAIQHKIETTKYNM